MINLQDLRIGNLIKWNGEVVRVTGVFEDSNEITAKKSDGSKVEDIADAFDEIPITEFWLFKSLFREGENHWFTKTYSTPHEVCVLSYNSFSKRCGIGEVGEDGYPAFTKETLFVHDLQNIYRDLTRENLPIQL